MYVIDVCVVMSLFMSLTYPSISPLYVTIEKTYEKTYRDIAERNWPYYDVHIHDSLYKDQIIFKASPPKRKYIIFGSIKTQVGTHLSKMGKVELH